MPTETLLPIEWMMVIVFIAGALVRGLLMHKSTGTLENLFLAGRKVPAFIASLSTVATNFNANDFFGSAGLFFGVGAVMLHGNLANGIALLFVALFVMQKLRRINAFTLGGWLEKRYSPAVGSMYSFAWAFVWMLFNLGLYIYAGSLVLHTLVGWDLHYSMVGLAVIAAFYTLLGGFGAVIASDVLGVALMFFPFVFLAFSVWSDVGGPIAIAKALPEAKAHFWASQTPFGGLTMMLAGLVFFALSYWTSEAQIVQRPLSAKSEEDASLTYLHASFWYTILVPLLISVPALAAITLFPVDRFPQLLESPDFSMALLIRTYIPRGLYGVMVVGLMAGVFSSADSQINAFCAMFTSDIYRKLFAKNRPKEHYLNVSKIAGVIFTLAAIGTAFLFSTPAAKKMGMMLFAFAVLATIMPPFAAITILGALSRRFTKHGAIAGLVAGAAVSIALIVAFNIDYNRILAQRYTAAAIDNETENAPQIKVTFETEQARIIVDYKDDRADDITTTVTADEQTEEGRFIRLAWLMCRIKSIIKSDLYLRTIATFLTTALVAVVVSMFFKPSSVVMADASLTVTKMTPRLTRTALALIAAIIIMATVWTLIF